MLSFGFGLATARADAVPPAPDSCPPGQVGVTGHQGPACVPEAPDDCAPGYHGQVGGKCVLAACSSDASCEPDERCMQVDTCQEFRELHWSGWGWSAQRPRPARNFIAGPPAPRPRGPAKKAWVQLSICHQDGPCASPAECRPADLCYRKDAIGKTKAKVAERGTPATDPAPSGQDPPAPKADTVVDPSGYEPKSRSEDTTAADGGGCRKGCTTASTSSHDGFLGAGLWILAALTLRRRASSAARSRG